MTTEAPRQPQGDRLTRALDHWSEQTDRLERQTARLQHDLTEARHKLEQIKTAVSLCDALETPTTPKYGIHSHIDPSELADCASQRAAGVKIAQLTEGRLKLSDASRLIYAAGLSDAKDSNGPKSTLHGMISVSDDWEKDDDDVYHLLTYRPNAQPQDGEQWPAESYPSNDGDESPPHLPGKRGGRGRSGANNRLTLGGILWIARTGAPWRDLPPEFGKWNTVYVRF